MPGRVSKGKPGNVTNLTVTLHSCNWAKILARGTTRSRIQLLIIEELRRKLPRSLTRIPLKGLDCLAARTADRCWVKLRVTSIVFDVFGNKGFEVRGNWAEIWPFAPTETTKSSQSPVMVQWTKVLPSRLWGHMYYIIASRSEIITNKYSKNMIAQYE